MVSRKIHILGCKDETSTPEGADLSVKVVNALNGDIIYSGSTTGDQMCIHEVIGLKDRLTDCVPNNAWQSGWPDLVVPEVPTL
jgi:hypothetical protein